MPDLDTVRSQLIDSIAASDRLAVPPDGEAESNPTYAAANRGFGEGCRCALSLLGGEDAPAAG